MLLLVHVNDDMSIEGWYWFKSTFSLGA